MKTQSLIKWALALGVCFQPAERLAAASGSPGIPLAPSSLADLNGHVLTFRSDRRLPGDHYFASAIRFRTNESPESTGLLFGEGRFPQTEYTRVSATEGRLCLANCAASDVWARSQLSLHFASPTSGMYLAISRGNPTNVLVTNYGVFSLSAGTNILPTILVQSGARYVEPGRSRRHFVLAMGWDLVYQWRSNGVPIPWSVEHPETNSPTFGFASYEPVVEAIYDVTIRNPIGVVTSPPMPEIFRTNVIVTQWPQSVAVTEGSYLELSVAATGSIFFYEWYFNQGGIPLPVPGSTTNATLVFPRITRDHAGSYGVRIFGDGEFPVLRYFQWREAWGKKGAT